MRPTRDMVRESIFNIIRFQCQKAVVLDLCAGTGALGLEALSNGAEHVTFMDTNINFIEQNTKNIDDDFIIIKGNIEKTLENINRKYDLIFFDPPYSSHNLYVNVLKKILDSKLLSTDGIIVVEHDNTLNEQLIYELFNLHKDITYGNTKIKVLKY